LSRIDPMSQKTSETVIFSTAARTPRGVEPVASQIWTIGAAITGATYGA
jgi:hypothetical protein